MAVVRVKRRCDEEPLDMLLLSCKKRKTNDDESETTVFKFAATVNDQEDATLYHTPSLKQDLKNTQKKKNVKLEDITNKLRAEIQQVSKNNRLKVVNCYRSLNLEESEINEASNSNDNKSLTVLDVECNEETTDKATEVDVKNHPEYVYDLYYMSSEMDLNDLQLEQINSVHGIDTEMIFDYRDSAAVDSDVMEDDDDDSNDENNWRNDYPDEEDYSEGDLKEFEEERGVSARLSAFRLSDEDDLSSDEDQIYSEGLSPTDIANYGTSYAKYKARVNRDEYDSSCSVDDGDSIT